MSHLDDQPADTVGAAADAPRKKGINLLGLIALVISSSIGSGVFTLSTDISAAAARGRHIHRPGRARDDRGDRARHVDALAHLGRTPGRVTPNAATP